MTKAVAHGAQLECNHGASPASLVVTSQSFVKSDDQLLATTMDFAPMTNIPSFGMCAKENTANPQVVAMTSAAMGTPTPAPCIPVTTGPWSHPADFVQVMGFKMLTDGSTCKCAWNGTIKVSQPGQNTTVVESGGGGGGATSQAASQGQGGNSPGEASQPSRGAGTREGLFGDTEVNAAPDSPTTMDADAGVIRKDAVVVTAGSNDPIIIDLAAWGKQYATKHVGTTLVEAKVSMLSGSYVSDGQQWGFLVGKAAAEAAGTGGRVILAADHGVATVVDDTDALGFSLVSDSAKSLFVDELALDKEQEQQDKEVISKGPGIVVKFPKGTSYAALLDAAQKREGVRLALDTFAKFVKQSGVTEVHILACNVGSATDGRGKKFVKALALRLGVKVIADSQYLRVDRMATEVVIYYEKQPNTKSNGNKLPIGDVSASP